MSEQSRSAFDAGQCQKVYVIGLGNGLVSRTQCPQEGVRAVGDERLCTECARYARRRREAGL